MDPNNLPQLYEEFCSGEQPTLPVNAGGAAATTLPPARVECGIEVRVATLDTGSNDFPFIDTLQKMHTHMVGWFPRKQMQTYIEGGWVLIAEKADESRTPLGYIVFKDEYKRREDLGIVYQLNVLPMKQRSLIGATLVHEAFERAAYGCKLFCCWCAQDIQANFFWESIGFVPLGFRTGSRDKQRIHIFWQRRIREDDRATEYWFPYRTDAGAVREDRLVLPIPPGTHWRDAKPVIVPELPESPESPESTEFPELGSAGVPARLEGSIEQVGEAPPTPETLPGGAAVRPRPTTLAELRSQSKRRPTVVSGGRVKYVDDDDQRHDGLEAHPTEASPPTTRKKPRRKARRKLKHDPEHVRIARDVRDRYLEAVNLEANALPPSSCGKWDVSRGFVIKQVAEVFEQESLTFSSIEST